jgi:hypothetical protein
MNEENVIDRYIYYILYTLYTIEFYSAIRNNTMWFEGKWMQMEDIMLSEVSQAQKGIRPHDSSPMWKIDPNDKHKNKHDHVQTHM